MANKYIGSTLFIGIWEQNLNHLFYFIICTVWTRNIAYIPMVPGQKLHKKHCSLVIKDIYITGYYWLTNIIWRHIMKTRHWRKLFLKYFFLLKTHASPLITTSSTFLFCFSKDLDGSLTKLEFQMFKQIVFPNCVPKVQKRINLQHICITWKHNEFFAHKCLHVE